MEEAGVSPTTPISV